MNRPRPASGCPAGSRLPRYVVTAAYTGSERPYQVTRCATREGAERLAGQLRREAAALHYQVAVQVFEVAEQDTIP